MKNKNKNENAIVLKKWCRGQETGEFLQILSEEFQVEPKRGNSLIFSQMYDFYLVFCFVFAFFYNYSSNYQKSIHVWNGAFKSLLISKKRVCGDFVQAEDKA